MPNAKAKPAEVSHLSFLFSLSLSFCFGTFEIQSEAKTVFQFPNN